MVWLEYRSSSLRGSKAFSLLELVLKLKIRIFPGYGAFIFDFGLKVQATLGLAGCIPKLVHIQPVPFYRPLRVHNKGVALILGRLQTFLGLYLSWRG
jgi:hypothetical protein